jgi:hypothetical protein
MPISAAASSSNALRVRDKARDLGQGKRGGFRLLAAFGANRTVFLFGFAKNERENIEDAELTTLREIAATFLNASTEGIAQALRDGILVEVRYGGESEES